MLGNLQTPSILSHSPILDSELPSDTIDQSMFSHERDASSDIFNCTYVVHDAAEGIYHAANILCMLVDISMAAAASYDATPAFQDYMVWMLDSFLLAHEQRKRLRYNPSLYESCRKSDISSFCSIHALLYTTRAALSGTVVRKGYIVLSILCADLIDNAEDLTEQHSKSNICSSFLDLVALCREHDSMRRAVSLHLVPAIQVALRDESKCSSLGKDFQVNCFALTLHYQITNFLYRKQALPCSRSVKLKCPTHSGYFWPIVLRVQTLMESFDIWDLIPFNIKHPLKRRLTNAAKSTQNWIFWAR
jgi:serine/threonine-protein kinase ATR